MQFSRDDTPRYAVTRYDAARVRIAGEDHEGSLAVAGDGLIPDWHYRAVGDLDSAALETLVARAPEVIVLAVGDSVQFPDAAALRAVMRAGVGIEVMNDGAAVRTYNIMLSEGRRVILALIR